MIVEWYLTEEEVVASVVEGATLAYVNLHHDNCVSGYRIERADGGWSEYALLCRHGLGEPQGKDWTVPEGLL